MRQSNARVRAAALCTSGTLKVMRIVNTADGSRTLYSDHYEQTMHSRQGALTESRHVFLKGAGVAAQLGQDEPMRVLEIGFGTGLNFFVTADLALTTHTPLDYVALERDLLPSQVIRELEYERGLEHKGLLQTFFDARDKLPEPPPVGRYAFHLAKGVGLELRLGEATDVRLEPGQYGAVYMDAFSPDANPELWTEDFLEGLYHTLIPGGTLSSYCVKGAVRRRLQALGFTVRKRPGPPGGKREMLVATKRAVR